MAEATGVSKSTVRHLRTAFRLQPHRQQHFQLSTDPFFAGKVRDIVGLHLHPPDHTLVLCVDEKSRTQAPGAPSPSCPSGWAMSKACLPTSTSTSSSTTNPQTRPRPALARRPAPLPSLLHPHAPPRLNQVEIRLHLITQKAIRRGSFASVARLKEKIRRFTDHYNPGARPFVWTATADSILSKI